MTNKTLKTRIQVKRDTASNWETNNPVLLNGEEIIVDTSAGEVRMKIGDGKKTYTQLPFTDENLRSLISGKVDKVSGKTLSTNDFTTTYKTKLDGIAEGANKYTHPTYTAKANGLYKITVDSNGHVSAATSVEKGDITGLGIPGSDTTYDEATTSIAGLMSTKDKAKLDGIASGANAYVHPAAHPATMITADASHRFVTDSQISSWNAKASTAVASTTANGLMSADDKKKLDGIAAGANATVVDDALDAESTNPVQNKVVNTALAGKANSSHTHTKSQITDFPSSLKNPTAFTLQLNGASQGAYDGSTAKTVNITAASIGADASGAATSALTSAKSYTDTKISDLINGAPTTLDTLGEIAEAMKTNDDVVAALNTAVGSKADNSALTSHTGNTTVHITASERSTWNAKASTAVASTTANGLMSAADKKKLDGIAAGANATTVDSALSTTSTNPVQNKVVNASIASLQNSIKTLESNYNTILAKLKTAVFWE